MKAKRKIRGVFFRAGVAYICYQDARGSIVRESTRQNSITVAAVILAKRRSEVAMGLHYPTRQFETTRFEELEERWWEQHGKHTASCFRYLRERIKDRFNRKRARDIRPPLPMIVASPVWKLMEARIPSWMLGCLHQIGQHDLQEKKRDPEASL